jgi:hypothetical protein
VISLRSIRQDGVLSARALLSSCVLLLQAPFITYPQKEVIPGAAEKTLCYVSETESNCDALLGMSVFDCVFCLLLFNRNVNIVIKSYVYELPLPSSVKPAL